MTYKCLYTEKQVMLNKENNKRQTKGTDAGRGTYLIRLRESTKTKDRMRHLHPDIQGGRIKGPG